MPEFYSSNVNQAPKAEVKSVLSDREPSNLIYLLKEDDEHPISKSLVSKPNTGTVLKSLDPGSAIKNQIQKDLLLLLKQQPQKFLSYNLIDKFNCTDKQNGIHRDFYNCEKFYICNNNNKSDSLIVDFKSEIHDVESMKEFVCPANTTFTMDGCFCEKIDKENVKTCSRIDDTLCRKL